MYSLYWITAWVVHKFMLNYCRCSCAMSWVTRLILVLVTSSAQKTRYNYLSVNKIITMTWLFMAIEGWRLIVKASENVFTCRYGICTYAAFILCLRDEMKECWVQRCKSLTSRIRYTVNRISRKLLYLFVILLGASCLQIVGNNPSPWVLTSLPHCFCHRWGY